MQNSYYAYAQYSGAEDQSSLMSGLKRGLDHRLLLRHCESVWPSQDIEPTLRKNFKFAWSFPGASSAICFRCLKILCWRVVFVPSNIKCRSVSITSARSKRAEVIDSFASTSYTEFCQNMIIVKF
jgi:hypothetical protein